MRVALQAPTGAGKMEMLLLIALLCIQKGRKPLFVCHLREILDDAKQRAREHYGFELQTASIHSITLGDNRPEADVILYDEVAHLPASKFRRLLELYPEAWLVGAGATICRSDDRPLSMFERLIVAATYSELIQAGRIVPAKVWQPEKQVNGLATDPVKAYLKYASGKRGFVFTLGIENSEALALEFRDAGVPCIAVHSKSKERNTALARLASGDLTLLVSDALLTEGVNVPSAEVCVLASAVNFVGQYMQKTGRVLRSYPGKQHATVLDLVGASLQFGMPHMDREFTLEGKKFDRSVIPTLRVCQYCGYTQLSGGLECESCDFTFPIIARRRPTIHSMELREVFDFEATPESAKRKEFDRLVGGGQPIDWVIRSYKEVFSEKPPQSWLAALPPERKRKEYENWKRDAARRGIKPGYAFVRFEEAFGHSPRG